jgi:hypothetical protein
VKHGLTVHILEGEIASLIVIHVDLPCAVGAGDYVPAKMMRKLCNVSAAAAM